MTATTPTAHGQAEPETPAAELERLRLYARTTERRHELIREYLAGVDASNPDVFGIGMGVLALLEGPLHPSERTTPPPAEVQPADHTTRRWMVSYTYACLHLPPCYWAKGRRHTCRAYLDQGEHTWTPGQVIAKVADPYRHTDVRDVQIRQETPQERDERLLTGRD